MKSIFLFSFLLLHQLTFAQEMLQDVITDYQNMRSKNKYVKVSLPEGTNTIFYRVTVFNTSKVNTYDTFYQSLRLINTDSIRSEKYNFDKHQLEPNAQTPIDVFFFDEESKADYFVKKDATDASIADVQNITHTAGKLKQNTTKELFVGIRFHEKKFPVIVKTEIVALSTVKSDANDKYPYSIQNETNGEVSYEISGSRRDWDVFYLPTRKKADFKLAAPSVYLRVSTIVKSTEEYFLESGKKYRLYWNKDKQIVDLSEISKINDSKQ
jgi:hypothetical protein